MRAWLQAGRGSLVARDATPYPYPTVFSVGYEERPAPRSSLPQYLANRPLIARQSGTHSNSPTTRTIGRPTWPHTATPGAVKNAVPFIFLLDTIT